MAKVVSGKDATITFRIASILPPAELYALDTARHPGCFAKLPIGGYEVEVHWVKDLHEVAECAGRYTEKPKGVRRIELEIALPPVEALETLVHECVHAIEDIFGLDLDESTVRILGVGLHQMLRGYLRAP